MKALETPEEKRERRLAKKAAKDEKRKNAGEGSGGGKDRGAGREPASAAGGADKKEAKHIDPTNKFAAAASADNAFGDSNINERFVWHKKYESLEARGVSKQEVVRREESLRKENEVELMRVRKAREQRELEKELMEQEQDMLLRERENEMFADWVKQEDSFHLNQAKQRTEIRLREGRAKPIDLVARYVHTSPEDMDASMHEPYMIFNGLSLSDLEDLHADINVYIKLERDSSPEYWQDMAAICERELTEKKRETAASNPNMSAAERRALETGVSPQIRENIMKMLRGKSHGELITLQEEIKKRISSGDAVDISFWEAMLGEMRAQLARARLRERHQAMLEQALQALRMRQMQQQGEERESSVELSKDSRIQAGADRLAFPVAGAHAVEPDTVFTESDLLALQAEEAETAARKNAINAIAAEDIRGGGSDMGDEDYRPAMRSFSPPPVPLEKLGSMTLLDPYEDARRLAAMRQDVAQRIKTGRLAALGPVAIRSGAGQFPVPSRPVNVFRALGGPDAAAAAAGDAEAPTEGEVAPTMDVKEAAFQAEARRALAEDEETFNNDMVVATKYTWADKYRPRKPRFFNRVMTGFEWNQYNRSHYDLDNPPPKIVQGYKFNIFYPDLIDKSSTPTFIINRIPDEPGFATITFRAGPPYEDIAFKILDLPWVYSRRTGFRCQFDRTNVFQLWFHFLRERYRR